MWIQCTNPATSRLYNADIMDTPVSFSDTGTAQVPKDIGEAMVERYDAIEPTDNEADD